MTTNGFLFDEKMITHAKNDWHLEKVQITLDDTEHVYNQIKNYKQSDGSPYRRVIHNILRLLQADIKVMIRLNLSLENAENLSCLITELKERFSCYKNFQVYLAPLNGLCTEVHYRKSLKLLQMKMFSTWTAWKKGQPQNHQ